jgi:hypothetical protein
LQLRLVGRHVGVGRELIEELGTLNGAGSSAARTSDARQLERRLDDAHRLARARRTACASRYSSVAPVCSRRCSSISPTPRIANSVLPIS